MGPFPGYHDARCAGVPKPARPDNVESMREVIRLHRAAVEDIHPSAEFAYLKDEARAAWDRALSAGEQWGYRNAQVTVLAPTGTISFAMDCDTTGIEPDIALVKYKNLAGGGQLKIVNRTVPEALRRLGYSPDQIETIVAHIERYDTIEDATLDDGTVVPTPLRPEHLPVFDCAFKPRLGRRSIHYLAHLKMMAAAQPFLSGAISKTVNMPHEATPQEIRDAYVQAWKLGLKCVAIYRDGSKRSQPLNTSRGAGAGAGEAAAELEQLRQRVRELEALVERLQKEVGKPLRRRLPEVRQAVNHKFSIANHEGYLNVGLFADGQPGELFITMAKEGSTIGGLMDTIATLTSIALQYGVPLEALVKKFSHQRFEPSGFTKNRDVPVASSITDYIFRWLAFQFLPGYREEHAPNRGQQELPMPDLQEQIRRRVNVSVPDLPVSDDNGGSTEGNGHGSKPAPAPAVPGPALTAAAVHRDSFVNQADAPICPTCGSQTVRNGACFRCRNCGESLGCS
jgi:ribonucleoside-diphosphate reductase alpha chain